MTSSGAPISEYPFIRTGLLGFIGPGGLVFVVGKMDGLMVVSGRRHNADDIVATALAVEPMKFVYRGRYASLCFPPLAFKLDSDIVTSGSQGRF